MKRKTGVELIAEERHEQLVKHEYTVESDRATNTRGQLASAAAALITEDLSFVPKDWNEELVDYMVTKGYLDRLIIAGALIAAEIDRINTDDYGKKKR